MRIAEARLRYLVRAILEGRAEFHDDVKDIKFSLPFGDPLFQSPESKPYKEMAKDIKRSWNTNVGMKMTDPDRAWIQSLTKVHWIYGHEHNLADRIERTMSSDRRGEVSATLYEPGKPVKLLRDWGNLGLRIDGWVSLAAKDMDVLLSGYIGDAVPEDPAAKKPRYPTVFTRHTPGTYIMSPKDQLFGRYASGRNEAFVGNWSPAQWVIGPGFYNQINGWDNTPQTQAILEKIKSAKLTPIEPGDPPIVDLNGQPINLDLDTLLDYMTRSAV